jgi:LPS export ABC transporter permease LptG/LPS export ABC transporter permease LptF
MTRILDRYALRQILPPFVLALLVFTFMLMMQPIDRNAQALLEKGVSVPVVAKMLALLLPQSLAITIPMAFLMGLLVAFGRLSADSEWVAMQACGVSLFRMLRPVLMLALLSWALTQWVLVDLVPDCNQAFREMEYGVVAARVESEIKPRIFYEDFPNLVLYARDTSAEGQGWRDVFVADTAQGAPQVSVARRGRMLLDPVARTVRLMLEDRVSFRMGTDAAGRSLFEANPSRTLVTELDAARVFPQVGPIKGEPEKTMAELRQSIADLRRQGLPTDRPEYYIHLKFSIPVACFVFALMGLGFGVGTHRGGKLAAFALGSGVIFAYYLVMYQARSLSLGGRFPAWLAAMLPNIVLGPVGALVAYRRARSSGGSFPLLISARGLLARWVPVRPAAAAAHAPSLRVPAVRFPRVRLPQPGLLDRYIATRYLRVQALTFLSLLGIFYISEFIDLSDKLFRGSTTSGLLLRYFAAETPQLVYYIVPISVLIATLVTVGALTRSSELVVMRACGVSLYRAALPLLALAVAASVVLFGLEEYVLVSSNRRAADLDHQIRSGSPRVITVLNRRWTSGRNGDIYHYDQFDPRRGELRNFWRYQFDQTNWRLTRITYAASVRFDPGSLKPDDGTATWQCRHGWVRTIALDGGSDYSVFSTSALTMEPADYFGTEPPDAASMTFSQLRDYIDSMRDSGLNILPQLVDLHRKIAFPPVTIVMTLLAVPFAVSTGRRGALFGIGVGMVFAIVYWTTNNLFGVVGAAGLIAPALAAWAPNLLFGAGAAYLMLTVRT